MEKELIHTKMVLPIRENLLRENEVEQAHLLILMVPATKENGRKM